MGCSGAGGSGQTAGGMLCGGGGGGLGETSWRGGEVAAAPRAMPGRPLRPAPLLRGLPAPCPALPTPPPPPGAGASPQCFAAASPLPDLPAPACGQLPRGTREGGGKKEGRGCLCFFSFCSPGGPPGEGTERPRVGTEGGGASGKRSPPPHTHSTPRCSPQPLSSGTSKGSGATPKRGGPFAREGWPSCTPPPAGRGQSKAPPPSPILTIPPARLTLQRPAPPRASAAVLSALQLLGLPLRARGAPAPRSHTRRRAPSERVSPARSPPPSCPSPRATTQGRDTKSEGRAGPLSLSRTHARAGIAQAPGKPLHRQRQARSTIQSRSGVPTHRATQRRAPGAPQERAPAACTRSHVHGAPRAPTQARGRTRKPPATHAASPRTRAAAATSSRRGRGRRSRTRRGVLVHTADAARPPLRKPKNPPGGRARRIPLPRKKPSSSIAQRSCTFVPPPPLRPSFTGKPPPQFPCPNFPCIEKRSPNIWRGWG